MGCSNSIEESADPAAASPSPTQNNTTEFHEELYIPTQPFFTETGLLLWFQSQSLQCRNHQPLRGLEITKADLERSGRRFALRKGKLSADTWVAECTPCGSKTQLSFVVKKFVPPPSVAHAKQVLTMWTSDLTAFMKDTGKKHHPILSQLLGVFPEDDCVIVCCENLPFGNASKLSGLLRADALKKALSRVAFGLFHQNRIQLPHRHLTMDNILISYHGCVLSDCALGALFAQMTATEIFEMGYRSASVFPPETITDRAPEDGFDDEKCDIWSFGCVAFRLAFGREPFVGETKEKLFESIRKDDLQFPPQSESEFDPRFVSIVSGCLAKNPSVRPTTMSLIRQNYLFADVRNMSVSSSARPSVIHRPSTSVEVPLLIPPTRRSITPPPCSSNDFSACRETTSPPHATSLDIRLVEGVLECSNCMRKIEKSFLGCDICETFALCAGCASLEVPHDPTHVLESYAVGETETPIISLVKRASSVKPRHENSKYNFCARMSSGETDLPEARMVDSASHSSQSSRASLVVPMARLSQEEQTMFFMTGELPPQSKLEAVSRSPVENFTSVDSIVNENLASKSVELDLNTTELIEIPPRLGEKHTFAHVVFLDLSNNQLSSIEALHFGGLSNLKELRIADNKIRHLPESIGDLCKLQKLEANRNYLSELPQTLMFLDALSYISLDYNCFATIPDVVFDIASLKILYLAGNNDIQQWPSVELLSHIESLDIGLDNEPDLFSEYQDIAECIPGVKVMWNNIYPDEVVPGLFCGSLRSVQEPHVYSRLHITHILSVGRGLEALVPPGMRHIAVLIDDFEEASMAPLLDQAFPFIDEALDSGGGCIVHCFAGISRSSTTVIAYLMDRRKMRLDDAYKVVRKARRSIYPNDGFYHQLIIYDSKLFPNDRPLDLPLLHREERP